ncbi:MAG: amidohydrolase family protein [Sphingobium sp.]
MIKSVLTSLAFCMSLMWFAPAHADEVGHQGLLITNVRILDLSGSEPAFQDGMSVLTRGDVVEQVGPKNALAIPEKVATFDGQGMILMPGLVDMHVHLWDEAALGAYLGHGITTIRNASGMPFHLRLAQQIASGDVVGPRLITTGPILNGRGANTQLNHQIVENEAQAREAVRSQYAAGYRHIKVYSNLSRNAYFGARDEARKLGMTIMGHSPEGIRPAGAPKEKPFRLPFESLIDDGFVSFEHIETIVWHGLRNRYDEHGARALARRIAAAGVAVDPTLLAFYNLVRVAETRGEYVHRNGVDLLNPLLVMQEQPNYDRWAHEDVGAAQEAFDFFKRATKIFAEEGVTLVAGSDAGIFTNIPGQSLVDELHLLVDAGLSPFMALKAATYNAALTLDEETRVGKIAPGYRADFLLLRQNPLADIGAIDHPYSVVAAGRPYDRTMLDHLLETARKHDPGRTLRNVQEGLAAQGGDPDILNALAE